MTGEREEKSSCEIVRRSSFVGDSDRTVRSLRLTLEEIDRGEAWDGEEPGRRGVLLEVGDAFSLHLVSPRGAGTDREGGADVVIKTMLRDKIRIDAGDELKKDRKFMRKVERNE